MAREKALNHHDFGGRKAVEVGDGAGGGVGADIFHVDHVADVKLRNFHVERQRIERVACPTGESFRKKEIPLVQIDVF